MPANRLAAFLFMLSLLTAATGCHSARHESSGGTSDGHGVYRLGDASEIRQRDAADERVRALLRKSIPVVPEEITFAAAIEDIRKQTGATIMMNWSVLEAAGVEKDLLVKIDEKAFMSADKALRLIVQYVAGAALEPVAVVVRDGTVHISTRRDLQRWTDVRVYNIRELLDPIPTVPRSLGFHDGDLTIHLNFPNESPSFLFADPDQGDEPTRAMVSNQVRDLIMESVGSTSEWAAYGGEISTLNEFEGDLVVRTTPENHHQLAQLLAALRVSRAEARRTYEAQLKAANTAGLPDLLETLRRMEKKFDAYNEELTNERAKQKAGQQKLPEPGTY